MHSTHRHHFAALERRRRDLARFLERFDAPLLAERPSPGAWSLTELVHHFVLVDRAIYEDLQRAAHEGRRGRLGAHMRFGLLWAVLRLPVRIPAPPGAQHVMPYGRQNLADLQAEWAAIRRGWAAILETLEDPARLVYRHPVMGYFTAEQTLRFAAVHFDHHLYQVQRIAEALGYAWPTRDLVVPPMRKLVQRRAGTSARNLERPVPV